MTKEKGKSEEIKTQLEKPKTLRQITIPDSALKELRETEKIYNQQIEKTVNTIQDEKKIAISTYCQGIARAMGLDQRIGSKFLHAGPGFGGSCFPKDTRSAVHFARELGERFEVIEAALNVNQRQRLRMVEKIEGAIGGDFSGKTVGVLGLSFKPETDDMRDAPSVDIIHEMQRRGAHVRAFDPVAMSKAAADLPDVVLCKSAYETCEGAEALVLVTEWNQFRMLDLERIRRTLRHPVVVDLRNVYHPGAMREAGFHYVSVGRS